MYVKFFDIRDVPYLTFCEKYIGYRKWMEREENRENEEI